MQNWQEEQILKLPSLSCEKEIFQALIPLAKELGFEYCSYNLRTPIPISRPHTVSLNNFPEEWQTHYKKENYVSVDPTITHCMHSDLPIIWNEEAFSSTPKLWQEAQNHGLRFGWAQSSRSINGVNGMLTLVRSNQEVTEEELKEKSLKMTWLAQIAHQALSRHIAPKLLPELKVHLTKREISTLRWTGEGKTSSEIAEILNIKERTVNFHLTNAKRKLNSVNKTAAATRAAMLGLISY